MFRGNKYSLLSLNALPVAAGWITAIVGLVVIAGWQFDIAIIKSPVPFTESMKANTAVCFFLAGIAIILINNPSRYTKLATRLISFFILLISILSLSEYIFNYYAGIDELLFRDSKILYGTIAGRMAPNTSLNFILMAITLIWLSGNRNRSSMIPIFCLVFPLTASILALSGYLTGFIELAGPAGFAKMALHTSALFIVLCAGLMLMLYQRINKFSIEQKLFAGLTTAAAIIVFILVLSISGSNSAAKLNDLVEEAEHVRNQVDHIYEHLMDIESGDLIYLHSGDEKYLAIYKKGIDDLIPILDNLKKETHDNLKQQQMLIKLDSLVRERIEFSKKRILARKSQSEMQVLELYPLASGRIIVDSIRVVAVKMISEQENVIHLRNVAKTNQSIRNNFVIYSSLGLEILLLALIFAVAAKDIIGRRKAEEKLRRFNEELEKKIEQRTEQLIASNKELEAFSYSVSHDLRAPLRHIDTFIELLKSKIFQSADENVKHYMDIISNASKKLGSLIDDLLEYSKTGRTKLVTKEVDLNRLVVEVLAELKPQTLNRKIKWEIEPLPKIFADYDLIKLVYQNLLDNAIKYTLQKEEAVIGLYSNEDEEYFILAVRDNGAGFDMDYSDRLFGVFQRLHSESQFEGSGIGLANVRRIIHMHGGKVCGEGKVNEGAVFTLSIPKKII